MRFILGIICLFAIATQSSAQRLNLNSLIHRNPDGFPPVDSATCESIREQGASLDYNGRYRDAYDTLRFYVEHCYSIEEVWREFGDISGACLGMTQDGDTVWARYRGWLKDVLYLDPDSNYYCADLREYALSFAHRDEFGNSPDFRTTLAIYQFLYDSSSCYGLRFEAQTILKQYHKIWRDSVKDTLKSPFDTTLPSLDQIGQTFLRGFSAGVAEGTEASSHSIGELRAEKNPFSGDAELAYTTNLPTVAKLEVYDALGHMLWTDGQGYLDPGEHHQRIPITGWGAGTFYARLTTLKGEVKTVKLVHEQ